MFYRPRPRQLPDLDEIELTPENYSAIETQLASTVLHGRGVFPAFKHSRTHGIPVATIHFRSYIPELLPLATHFATHAAAALAIPVSKVVPLPTKRSLWTVLKGPFIYKKNQENFERKVHKRYIKAWDADPEVVQKWVTYLCKHALGGVGMRITTWERAKVGVGKLRLQSVRAGLKKATLTDPQKVKAVGEEIIRRELAAPVAEEALLVQELPRP
jgi:small subunit ribosomal protein S10